MSEKATVSNTPFHALRIGMTAEISHTCVADDLYAFAHATGDLNPAYDLSAPSDAAAAKNAAAKSAADFEAGPPAPSMFVGALIASVLGARLPGPGARYESQSLHFLERARAGDTLTAAVRVIEKGPGRVARFETWVTRASDGARIAEGEAVVIAPEKAQTVELDEGPGLTVRRHIHFDRLLAEAERLDPIPTAVVAPEEPHSLGGALLGAEHTLIRPILIGDQAKIEAAAATLGEPLAAYEVIDEPDHAAAAATAVRLAKDGDAQALMKGHLHTDVLLGAVLRRDSGLRTARRLSHVFVMDVPGLANLLLITDAAINIAPDLEAKVDITQNAIDLARALGVETPKVGVVSAVETVTPKIPSTLDAAALSKMADRGQIVGGVVDGPLAMDNAIDINAAKTKGIKSLVAGRADILVAPNLEAGNILAKDLIFAAHAEGGGVVLGARRPIILTSRADDEKARLASCAVAALYAERAGGLRE